MMIPAKPADIVGLRIVVVVCLDAVCCSANLTRLSFDLSNRNSILKFRMGELDVRIALEIRLDVNLVLVTVAVFFVLSFNFQAVS